MKPFIYRSILPIIAANTICLVSCASFLLPYCLNTNNDSNILKSNFSFQDCNDFSPTTINKDGFIEYSSSVDGLCAPNYNFFYENVLIDTTEMTMQFSLTVSESTYWAKIDGKNTYNQLFLNQEVAKYFADAAGGKDPNSPMINTDLLLINQFFKNNGNKCDLSGMYFNDQYRDETIKALANPLFHDMFMDLIELNLSNNNLWYIPMFGFEYRESLTTRHKLFSKLESLDLSNNKISHLPIHMASKISTGNNFDLTNTLNGLKLINLDNNFLVSEPELVNIGKTNWSNKKQSSWIYLQTDVLKKYISQQAADKLNLKDLSKIDLLGPSPLDPAKKIIDEINLFVLNYYQSNFLGSSVVYNEASSTSANASYCDIYIYANANLGSGEYVMSAVFKTFQYYNIQDNQLETSLNSMFFKTTIDGFLKNDTVLILTSLFIAAVGICVISFSVYNLFLKKKIAAKRKKKNLDMMQKEMVKN